MLFRSALVEGIALWHEVAGQKWLLTANGGVSARKIADAGGRPSLEPGWTFADHGVHPPPIVVNGVVFALSGGSASAPAVVYALDGVTGKELWNSGKTITSYVPGGRSFWSGHGQVYVGALDGTVYAFGFPMERK